ncbi:hypothetical protein [Sporolactobacillus pectinivorans]|uniref:hypothetical protein n=1 Tax=Sporolactobacillus pectinivorans TaxID=1591408 RepID=UPI0012FD2F8A|nr:hypothetical protein [Sporolactobacillus pectinivorans]
MRVLYLQESVPVDREQQLLKEAKNECLEQIDNGKAEPTEMLILEGGRIDDHAK